MTTKTTAAPPEERAWTVTDVACFLKVSVRHVYNLRVTDRTFPEPVKVGTALRWPPRAVPSWLEHDGSVLPPHTSSPNQRKGAGRVC